MRIIETNPLLVPEAGRDWERQVQRLQTQAERLEKWIKDNEPKYGTAGRKISSNLAGNESAKMKISHGVIQGYNSQALRLPYVKKASLISNKLIWFAYLARFYSYPTPEIILDLIFIFSRGICGEDQGIEELK